MNQRTTTNSQSAASTGFTIVELLIVIVILGILATIVIIAYNGMVETARANAVADGFKQFEKSMRLYAYDEGLTMWPHDAVLAPGGNPSLEYMVANVPKFKNWIQSSSQIPGVVSATSIYWYYDFDIDVYDGCSLSSDGVNIGMYDVISSSMALKVDQKIDDGNLSCGKLRLMPDNRLLYSLSLDGTVNQ